MPWLEPDIGDRLEELANAGERAVVVVPIGFVSDHMEVAYDLDTEAAEQAANSGSRSSGPQRSEPTRSSSRWCASWFSSGWARSRRAHSATSVRRTTSARPIVAARAVEAGGATWPMNRRASCSSSPSKLLAVTGEFLIDARPADLVVATKSSPTDVVTQMDTAAERLIANTIRASRPDDAMLGEEGQDGGASDGRRVRWIVDPIDGTVNYLYGLPQWAVSIAAEVAGVVVAGAVLDPSKGELFTASGAAALG